MRLMAKTYKVPVDVSVQDSYMGERFEREFKAGTHSPKSEVEEYALQVALSALGARPGPGEHERTDE